MADERSIKEALNRALNLQPKKTEAGKQAKMGEIRGGNSKRTWSPATEHHKTGLAVLRRRSSQKRLSTETCLGGRPDLGKRVRAGVKKGPPASSPSTRRFTLNVLARRSDNSLITDCCIEDKTCHLPKDTRTSWAITSPDTTAGLPDEAESATYYRQHLGRLSRI